MCIHTPIVVDFSQSNKLELKTDIHDLPDFAKPSANINPYSEDADKKILEI